MMELYFKTRIKWREWLEKNHASFSEVWLAFYKKASGKPGIKYEEAVEEALCFGWIDGKLKKVNEEYYIQRYTPRRPGSKWSKYNLERVKKLRDEGYMKPAGLLAYHKAVDDPSLVYENRMDGDPVIPDDLMKVLRENKIAYKNFLRLSRSNRRIYIHWLNDAKKTVTRNARILKIVESSEKNIRPGMI